MKQFIALFIVFTMLFSISPSVAADDMTTRPTVEEILSEYHQKAFESETATAAACSSRAGSGERTLEQETVDTLNAAGYEAYNVTSENYETLENQLQTDFADMGLDPDGSYIITLHGDDSENSTANGISPRAAVPAPDPGGSNTFTYTYNGTTYTMRYVTITAADGYYMRASSIYNLAPSDCLEDGITDIFSTFLITAADSLDDKCPVGTIASLIFGWMQDDNYTALEPDTLTLHATTTWTCDILQIKNDYSSQWISVQGSAYAVSRAHCAGYVYNPNINDSVWYDGVEYSNRSTSPKYSNYSQRKLDAVTAYIRGEKSYDCTGDIDFFLGNEEGEVVYSSDNRPLFTHCEGWIIG